MTYCRLFFGLVLLFLVAAETVRDTHSNELEMAMVYRRMVTQQNVKTIETHNQNPSATFKMSPHPAFVGFSIQ
jgi:hypothetical protein